MSQMFPIQNEEHISARQGEANHSLDVFQNSLSDLDKKKFDAISKCFKILKENDVSAFIFPVLPTPDGTIGCYQYNNALDFIKYDESSKVSAESAKKLMFLNSFFCSAATSYLRDLFIRDREFNWDLFIGAIYNTNKFVRENKDVSFYEKSHQL